MGHRAGLDAAGKAGKFLPVLRAWSSDYIDCFVSDPI